MNGGKEMIENEMDADAFYNDEMKKAEQPVYPGGKDYAVYSIRCEDIKIQSADGDTLVRFYLDEETYAFAHLTLSAKDGKVEMRIYNEEQ